MGRRWLAEGPWQYQAASMQRVLPSPSRRLQPVKGGGRRKCVCMGPLQEQQPRSGASAAGPACLSPAQEGQARQVGPRAVKEKNIPRPANCCSQLPPPPPLLLLGVKKKKAVLPLEADANGCRILTISCINQAFPKQSLPGTRQRHYGKGVVGEPTCLFCEILGSQRLLQHPI